jgi:hypothetical protein
VAARLPASVSAVKATAVILDFVMVVSIRFKVGRHSTRRYPEVAAERKKVQMGIADGCAAPQNGDKLEKC